MDSIKDKYQLVQYHLGIDHFDYNIAIEWAIELMKEGKDSDNICMLASFSKPTDSEEIKPYLSEVLTELNLEEKTGSEAVIALISFYMNQILANNNIRGYLTELCGIIYEKDGLQNDTYNLMNFYLLHHGWSQLEDIGVNHYFAGASLNNIEEVVRDQAENWLSENLD
ncbi:MAG: hypothetical protein MK105_12520 [Crocinitomicaceae bacterium]|nr:hypothetical protein [Crocinitomicaceae bacterium]